MTTAVAASNHVDPMQHGKYGLKLREGGTIEAVAYNHKSRHSDPSGESIISLEGNELRLSIRDGQGQTRYRGRRDSQKSSYVLQLDTNGKSFELQPLGAQYSFDLIETPEEKDPVKLAKKYRQIESSQQQSPRPTEARLQSEDDEFEDDNPDPENAFDYRHYLSGIPGADVEGHSRNASAATTPVLAPTPLHGPLVGSTRLNSKPVSSKAQSKPPRRTTKSRKVPSNRTAVAVAPAAAHTTTEAEVEGLIIENDSQPAPKRQRLLTPNNAPISLREATSTPRRDANQPTTPMQHDAGSGYDEEDVSDEDDDIIEDLKLPGPAEDRPAPKRRQSVWEADEVEDLLAALDDGADEVPQSTQPAVQSDSESEEE